MLEGTISTLSLKDASHSLMEETLPELLRSRALVRDESNLDGCMGVAVCWVIDKAPVPRIS